MGEAGVKAAAMAAGLAAAAAAACAPTFGYRGDQDNASPAPIEQGLTSGGREAPVSAEAASAGACDADSYRQLIGQTFEEARASAELPRRVRFICEGCLATGDFVADRLNLYLDADGRVARLTCG
ncbi:MAG: hypothetical protein MI723_01150 [Caulobacterales bacterium]|nr:hypothetical protein [Caulobacterales bacterium]